MPQVQEVLVHQVFAETFYYRHLRGLYPWKAERSWGGIPHRTNANPRRGWLVKELKKQ
jgi:hypothetical protein